MPLLRAPIQSPFPVLAVQVDFAAAAAVAVLVPALALVQDVLARVPAEVVKLIKGCLYARIFEVSR